MAVNVLPSSQVEKYLDNLKLVYTARELPNLKITYNKSNSKSILAIDYADLINITDIPWHKVNVVFLETFQQAVSAREKFDPSKSYIFVAESAIDSAVLRDALADLTIMGVFTVFNEVLDYGQQLFNYSSQIPMLDLDRTTTPEFDFFCLLGRRTRTRKQLFGQLAKFDVSKSLIKYHGQRLLAGGAPDLDTINYDPLSFYVLDDKYHGQNPGKLFQEALYKNFKFEVQHETDPNDELGWRLPEYHITEKTVKPLVVGFPCLMFGPQKYNIWLGNFGIDLGLEKFNFEFDLIHDNSERLQAMTEQLPNIINSSYTPPTQDAIDKNIVGLIRLSRYSIQNLKSLCDLLLSL